MDKKVLMNVESVYTAFAFRSGGRDYVAAGSETCPEVFLYDLGTGEKELVAGCPGGVMSFVPVPGIPDVYFSVMGLFPGFIGQQAGIFMHRKGSGGWKTEKVFPLPFAHRCDVVHHKGRNYLFAVSVSKFKADPADWSNASEIHVMSLDPADAAPGPATLVESSIFRNHGMLKTEGADGQTLYVSGAEGIFRLEMDDASGKWNAVKVFDREVSEFGFVDIDSDGREELATIEPFHGNTLNIYRQAGDGQWNRIYQGELEFGHGLSCGHAAGKPRVVVGNRRGPLTLDTITYIEGSADGFRRETLETEAGPTQTQVFEHGGKDYILSANQRKNEVAIYW